MSKEVVFLLMLLCSITCCKSQKNSACVASSCGDVRNIHFPFRLKGDPINCGYSHPSFELECQNNRTILDLDSRRYYVLSITYDDFLIRVVEQALAEANNTCTSLPKYFTGYDEVPSNPGTVYFSTGNDAIPGDTYRRFLELNTLVIYVKCLSLVNSSRYIETAFCDSDNRNVTSFLNSSRVHSYVAVVGNMNYDEVEESCSIEMVAWAASNGPVKGNRSLLSTVKHGLAYGFELSWFRVLCQECEWQRGFCSVQGDVVTCQRDCVYSFGPISELSFRCQFEHYRDLVMPYVKRVIGALIGVRFVCGFSLLLILIMYKWRRRHLSMDETVEEFLQVQNNLMPIN